MTRDNKSSDIGLYHENNLPERTEEEGATEQNELFLLRSPEFHDKRLPGERDEVVLSDNSNPDIFAAVLSYQEGNPATRSLKE